MTMEERFERIETDLAATTGTLRKVADLQERQVVSMIELTGTISRHIDQTNERMQRLEANLDGLIRAITAEHSNGKKP
jgi:hypothetical protein